LKTEEKKVVRGREELLRPMQGRGTRNSRGRIYYGGGRPAQRKKGQGLTPEGLKREAEEIQAEKVEMQGPSAQDKKKTEQNPPRKRGRAATEKSAMKDRDHAKVKKKEAAPTKGEEQHH